MIKYSLLLIMTISAIRGLLAITEPQPTAYDEKNDDNADELSEYDIAVLFDASEDYERNQEQCDKLYDMLEEGDKEDPDFEYN